MLDRPTFNQKVAQKVAHAKATGGCEQCFKPHDPWAPSCNNGYCEARWRQQNALNQRAKEGEA